MRGSPFCVILPDIGLGHIRPRDWATRTVFLNEPWARSLSHEPESPTRPGTSKIIPDPRHLTRGNRDLSPKGTDDGGRRTGDRWWGARPAVVSRGDSQLEALRRGRSTEYGVNVYSQPRELGIYSPSERNRVSQQRAGTALAFQPALRAICADPAGRVKKTGRHSVPQFPSIATPAYRRRGTGPETSSSGRGRCLMAVRTLAMRKQCREGQRLLFWARALPALTPANGAGGATWRHKQLARVSEPRCSVRPRDTVCLRGFAQPGQDWRLEMNAVRVDDAQPNGTPPPRPGCSQTRRPVARRGARPALARCRKGATGHSN